MIAIRRTAVTMSITALLLGVAACSAQSTPSAAKNTAAGHHTQPQSNPPATEYRPPGDIPDSQVYVPYRVPGSSLVVKVPEGWARSSAGGATTFSSKYNSIAIAVQQASSPPTVTQAKQATLPQLRRKFPKFAPGKVARVQLQGGQAVLITYLKDSAPNSVTGKVVRDAVQRFEFWHSGHEAILTLTGPKSADNVDPWHLVSNSVHWR